MGCYVLISWSARVRSGAILTGNARYAVLQLVVAEDGYGPPGPGEAAVVALVVWFSAARPANEDGHLARLSGAPLGPLR